MAVLGNGVRNGEVQNLLFGIGGYRDSALTLTGKIAAVDHFSSHTILFHRAQTCPR